MKLLVISHKKSWVTAGGFMTVGGFPLQMAALSRAFDNTTLLLPAFTSPPPAGAMPLTGHNLRVETLGRLDARNDWRRKGRVLTWWPRLWRALETADVVHIPLPGDVGALGLLAALLRRKPLFVRYCGPWERRTTMTERILHRLLISVAGKRAVVFATGGGTQPPEPRNPHIHWIFSTTLGEDAWRRLPQATPWQPGTPLRLVTVGRLSPVKNQVAIVAALPRIQAVVPDVTLHVVGGGPAEADLVAAARTHGVSVVFHGTLTHQAVLSQLAQSHLFVFPSHFEGFPKALLEALACGVPVVASHAGAVPQLIGGGAGILLDDTTPEAIAGGILRAVADADALAAMGAIARAVSRRYTLEAWVTQLTTPVAAGHGQPGSGAA